MTETKNEQNTPSFKRKLGNTTTLQLLSEVKLLRGRDNSRQTHKKTPEECKHSLTYIFLTLPKQKRKKSTRIII